MMWSCVRSLGLFGLVLVVGSCTTARTNLEAETRANVLIKIDQTLDRLLLIDTAVKSIQQRRTIELATPGIFHNEPSPPSKLYDRHANSADALSLLYMQLLESVASGKPLQERLVSPECNTSWGDTQRATTTQNKPMKSIAKAIDAVALVKFVPCPEVRTPMMGHPINTPGANMPSDTNFVALHAEAEKKKEQDANRPFIVPGSDVRALMIGQGYRFANKSDKDIFIPRYVSERFQAATIKVQELLGSHAGSKKELSIFYDRTRTRDGKDVMDDNPNGWFAAYADTERGELYFSPTLMRATFVLCGSQTQYNTLAPAKVAALRRDVEDRKITPNDANRTLASMNNIVDRFNSCMEREVVFLVGHELAHAMLEIRNEARADCVGRAVANALQYPSGGVFETLIFSLITSEDDFLLGAMPPEKKRQLMCRAKLHHETKQNAQVDFESALTSCRNMCEVCV